jgi:2-polyprenyl-3-methyl-5-hydroxy-6-metoxy-1,4-benzoquinol methylase
MNYEIPYDDFRSENYVEINHKRFEHFSSLNISLEGKEILELGARIGDHTENLLRYGPSSITSIESRAENIKIFRDRFENESRVEAIEMDLENPVDLNKEFYICYCYGLLYHLSNPDNHFEYIARHTTGVLFLETCVDYENEDTVNLVSEDQKLFSQSFSEKGCRPGRKWIFNGLREYFEHVYILYAINAA